jgi:CMP-N-acetylneuraminic acid synthetase
MKNNILFSICARGGSKGLPNKNISDFMGEPLIAITIQQALKSSFCNEIYVSTDSQDIADVAKSYGAKCISLRPKNLANDYSSKFDVWKHHLEFIEKELSISFDYFFDLDCTCPLRPDGDIDNMISTFIDLDTDYDGIITVCDSRKNPYFNMLELKNNNTLDVSKKLPDNIVRRQDAPIVIDHVASMYLFKSEYIKKSSSLFEGNVLGYKIPYERSLDIDSNVDKKLVGYLFNELNEDLGVIC